MGITEQMAIEELKGLREDDKRLYAEEYEALEVAIQALEEREKYRAIGTVEELQALKEKSVAKKPIEVERKRDEDGFIYQIGRCHSCGKLVTDDRKCCDCMQLLDWE